MEEVVKHQHLFSLNHSVWVASFDPGEGLSQTVFRQNLVSNHFPVELDLGEISIQTFIDSISSSQLADVDNPALTKRNIETYNKQPHDIPDLQKQK